MKLIDSAELKSHITWMLSVSQSILTESEKDPEDYVNRLMIAGMKARISVYRSLMSKIEELEKDDDIKEIA